VRSYESCDLTRFSLKKFQKLKLIAVLILAVAISKHIERERKKGVKKLTSWNFQGNYNMILKIVG